MADYEILKKVAEDTNFELNQLIDMYIAESSGRSDVVNPLGYVGGFQFGTTAGKEYGLVGKDFDYRKDLDKSARAAIEMFKNNTKPMSAKIDSLIKKRSLNPGLVGYLTHQQGRYGFQDIITAAESGNFGGLGTRSNILNNLGLSDSQKKEMDIIGPPTVQDNKNLANNFLNFWKERYSDKVKDARTWQKEGKNKADRKFLNPDKAVMDSVPLPPN